jgi:4-amino-4-deoxy-L-arabinose transferase-like glycosyltransferase
LQDSTIWDANEAFYAETPREMIESRDYVNPSFNYRPRFNKPVLSYWIVAASYRLFGVSEWSERLPIAAAAVVLIATAFALGRAAWSGEAGLFAALALATTPRFLMFARRIFIDMWITMFLGLTLLFFVLADVNPVHRRRYLLLMYTAAGLGVLTKGPVAVVLPALSILIYLVVERRLGDVRRMMIPAGVAIVSVIVLPWYVALYVQHGWVYIKEFFVDENILRYAQPVGAARRGLLFYLPVMLSDMFPWSMLLPVALATAWTAFVQGPDAATSVNKAQRMLLIWIAAIVLFFTFSQTKEDLYIFPVVPAEAALIGVVLARGRRSVRWSLVVIGAVVGAMGGALLAVTSMGTWYQLAGSRAVAFVALAGGVIALVLALRRRVPQSALALGSAFAVMSWVFVATSLPDFEKYKPVARFAEIISQRAAPQARIGYYRFAVPSLVFYTRRAVFESFDLESLLRVFASGDEVYCLMTAEDYAAVKNSLPGPTYVVVRQPLFDVKVQTLLEGTALPDIVLVSNRP